MNFEKIQQKPALAPEPGCGSVMSSSRMRWAFLDDARLCRLAVSALPAWLWSLDAAAAHAGCAAPLAVFSPEGKR